MNTKTLLACLLATTVGSTPALFAQGPRGAPPPPLDPETVAAESFAEFDADENNLLNEAELSGALQRMCENRMIVMAERRADRQAANGYRPNRQVYRNKMRGPVDSTALAQSFIENFDANGDASLDVPELLAALEDRCQPRMRGGPRGGRGFYRNAPPATRTTDKKA